MVSWEAQHTSYESTGGNESNDHDVDEYFKLSIVSRVV